MRSLACPQCGVSMSSAECGDLLTERCPACSHEQIAWLARVFPDMPRAKLTKMLIRTKASPTASQLRTVRAAIGQARSLSPATLRDALHSSSGLLVSPLAPGPAQDLAERLRAVGLQVEIEHLPFDS